MVKNIYCSSGGSGFKFYNPLGSSQQTVTPVPRNLMPSSVLCGYKVLTWYTDIQVGKISIHIKIKLKITNSDYLKFKQANSKFL